MESALFEPEHPFEFLSIVTLGPFAKNVKLQILGGSGSFLRAYTDLFKDLGPRT